MCSRYFGIRPTARPTTGLPHRYFAKDFALALRKGTSAIPLVVANGKFAGKPADAGCVIYAAIWYW